MYVKNKAEASTQKENILWSEKIAEEVLHRNKKEYIVSGQWTPSGYFHIGNARPEIFTPYAVKLALEKKGVKVRQNFIIDDFDVIRKIPKNLGISPSEEDKYLGYPCATAPSPLSEFKNWADIFTSQLKEYTPKFGFELNFISAYEMYKEGKFNELIRFTIEHPTEITQVWKRVSGSKKDPEFVPIQIVSPDTGKLITPKIINFDGKTIAYKNEAGVQTKISPYDGNAKLHWRVHWVANWIVNGVDFESAGKDHFSKGGSVDVAQALMKEVFHKESPVQVPTEFLQLKGAKMAGSVGNTVSLADWCEIASPELFRYLYFSYKPNSVIDLSLKDNSFVLLNERFERAERIFFGQDEAENEKLTRNLKKAYEYATLGKLSKQLIQLPFSTGIMFAQLYDFENELDQCLFKISEIVSLPKKMTSQEKEKLQLKLRRTKTWLSKYAPEELKLTFVEKLDAKIVPDINPALIVSLKELVSHLIKTNSPTEVQQVIFNTAKANNIPSKILFQTLYLIILGTKQGPKIGVLTFAFGKEKIIQRIQEFIDAFS